MQIVVNVLLFVFALVLTVKGGDYFVTASSSLAKKLKLPQVIVGATIVALATTMPEFIVSTIASAKGEYALSVGNAVGSMLSNIALICGISIFVLPSKIKKGSLSKYFILIFLSLFLLVSSMNGKLDFAESIVLVCSFVFYMIVAVLDAKKQKTKAREEFEEKTSNWKTIFLFVFGAVAIGVGASILVKTATNLSILFSINQEFIGLTIVAVGTSLPELITTIISIKRKEVALGYGNIIGANIINSTLLMGVSGLIAKGQPVALSKLSCLFIIPLLTLVTLVFVLPMMIKSKTFKWQGICLCLLYFLYLVVITISTLNIGVV